MGENKEVKVDEALYVNEATMELLRRRMETDIRRNFMQSIGVPIGGGGIIALLYLIFVWIPNNVDTLIVQNQQIQGQIQEAVTEYLKREEGVSAIQRQVESSMESEDVKGEIRQAVRKTLEDKMLNLSIGIAQNLENLVASVKVTKMMEAMQASEGIGSFAKGTAFDLNRFLSSQQADVIVESGQPFILDIAIGKGNRYAGFAIKEYIHALGERFGQQFRYIVLTDAEVDFLAMIPHEEFIANLDGKLMDILNRPASQYNLADIKEKLSERFGQQVISAISIDQNIGDALFNSSWGSQDLAHDVATIDSHGRLTGITSRKRMIDAVVNSIV